MRPWLAIEQDIKKRKAHRGQAKTQYEGDDDGEAEAQARALNVPMLDQARLFGRQRLFVGAEGFSRVRVSMKSKGEFSHGFLLELLFDPGPPAGSLASTLARRHNRNVRIRMLQ
jgi:hypothetical protein